VTAFTTLPAFPPAELNTTDTILITTPDLHRSRHHAHRSRRGRHRRPFLRDLLQAIIDELEKAAWMLKSENRKI
jgi:starvation-inducible DNA-binding protein